MYDFIKKLCHKLCHNLFEQSSQNCITQFSLKEKLKFLILSSTELYVKISREIEAFCKIDRNHFWIIAYRYVENKIDFSCQRCNKPNLCREYILSRIITHIKAFDSKKESVVFQKVRSNLKEKSLPKTSSNNTQEVIFYYTQKILLRYNEKPIKFYEAEAIIENIMNQVADKEIKKTLKYRLEKYRLYRSSIVLKDFLEDNSKAGELALFELLEEEKFKNYINRVIESRFIDFVRSKSYTAEIERESEATNESLKEDEVEEIEELLKYLSAEERLLYKLQYGIALNNREFLTIIYRFETMIEELIEEFEPKEKLYIKFSLHYKLEKDSKHFDILGDIDAVETSISKKVLNYREKLLENSYSRDEVVIKLIYHEALSAKELGELFSLTTKQIYKKIENITKKLRKVEQ